MAKLNMTVLMMQLMEHIESAFNKINITTHFTSVKEIIASDDNSAEFIREVLHDENYTALEHDNRKRLLIPCTKQLLHVIGPRQ